MRLKLSAALVVVFTLPLACWGGDKKDADAALHGTWLPASAEFGGNAFPDEVLKTMKLEIKDGKFKASVGKVVDQGTIKLDSSAKPARMETTGTDGPNKGRTFLAIYERDGDSLKVCYDVSGKNHPAEFKTKEGTQLFYVVYKRQKP